jgi:hypothetical protein
MMPARKFSSGAAEAAADYPRNQNAHSCSWLSSEQALGSYESEN